MKKTLSVLVFLSLVIVAGMWWTRDAVGIFLWETFQFERVAVLLNPSDAELLVDIGNHYFNVDKEGVYNLNRAEKYFAQALSVDPNVPDAWHQLARMDFLKGDFNAAVQKINRQIDIHGDSFMAAYYIRGLISGFRGDHVQAERDFKRFLEWDNDNWAAYNDLGWIYFEQGRFEEAANIAHDGLRFHPRNPWLLTMRGVSLMNLGNDAEAHALLASAQHYASYLTPEDWQNAYPGNDPTIAPSALREMQKNIAYNLSLVEGG